MSYFDIAPPESSLIKEKKRKKGFILKWWEIVIFVLVLGLTVFSILFFFFIRKVRKEIFKPQISSTYYYKGYIKKEEPKLDTSSYVSFLFLGIGGPNHEGGALTDSIQIAVIDKNKKEAYLFSVPRDLWVNNGKCGYQKINTMFWCGELYYGDGGAFSKNKVSEVLGIPINYYVRMDFEGFKKLIDILGGLDLEVEKDFSDNVVNLYISRGWHHLDGETVLKYVRSRYTDSDFDRSRRQQQVIMALRDKILKERLYLKPFKAYQIIKILMEYLRTDVNYDEAISYLGMIPDLKIVSNYVIDNRKDDLLYSTNLNGAYVLLTKTGDYSKIHEKVKQILKL